MFVDLIKMRFGDSQAGTWFIEVVNDCVREAPNQTLKINMNLLVQKCKGGPENVPIVLSVRAKDLSRRPAGADVFEATGLAGSFRLLIGSIFLACCASRGIFRRGIPKELDDLVMDNLIIMECVVFLELEKGFTVENLRGL
jgi:hypothetical protein